MKLKIRTKVDRVWQEEAIFFVVADISSVEYSQFTFDSYLKFEILCRDKNVENYFKRIKFFKQFTVEEFSLTRTKKKQSIPMIFLETKSIFQRKK